MIRAVYESSLDSHYREACQDALLHAVLKTLLDCGEEVAGNRSAEHSFLEYHIVAVAWLELYPYVSVLTVSAGLLLVASLNLDLLAYRLLVRYLRHGGYNIHSEAGLEL